MQASKAAGAGWMQGVAGLALVLLVAMVYWPGLTGPFLFDDFPALVSNARVHVAAGDWPGLWRAATSFDPGGTGRQLSMASFGLDHMLGGLEPWGWKLGGLLVHLLNALLVYVLCLRLLALAGVQQWRRLSAFAVALLWAVHPLQVSTVLYVVQRMETLCLTFILLALLAYLRGRKAQLAGLRGWPWLLACVLCFVLALGAKESALLLPLYTLALELSLLGFAGHTTGQRRFWRWGYGVGCAVALLLFVAVALPYYGGSASYEWRDFSASERVLSQLRILPLYLGQMLLPLPASMTFYYDDFVASTSLLQPWTTLAGGLLLAGLLVLAWWLRRHAPLAALGIFWFFAAHAITSNVIALELVFEHRNYFALLGVLLVLAELVRRIPVRDGPAIKIAGAAAAIVLIGFLGLLRAATWGDALLLATEHAQMNPRSTRAAQDLVIQYNAMAAGDVESPFFSFAVVELQRASQLPGASILAEQSLILLHAENDLPVDDAWWQRLIQRLQDRPVVHENVAAVFQLLNRRMDGVAMDDDRLGQVLLLLLERKQLPAQSYAGVAIHALKYRDDPALARRLFAQALERDDSEQYRLQLAGLLVTYGYPEWVQTLDLAGGG